MQIRTPVWKEKNSSYIRSFISLLRRNWIFLALCSSSIIAPILFHYMWAHNHKPPVGVYIAIMGAVTALMVFHENPTVWQKAAWIVFVTALAVTEIRNIYVADEEQTKTFRQITDDLKATKTGLDQAATKIAETNTAIHGVSDEMDAGLKRNINTITGGDSFCYLDIFPVMPEKNAVNHAALLGVKRVGKYPLHGITMTFNGAKRPIPDFATPDRAVGAVYLSGEDHESFSVFFSANNGEWLERIELRRLAPDKWVKAMWVEASANPYYVRIDKNYPRKANGEPDVPWPRLTETGAPAWEKPKH